MSTLRRVIIATKKAPDAIGPYNQVLLKHVMLLLWILINHFQAVQVDSTLYISGQIGFIPSTMQVTGKQLNKNVTNLNPKTRVCLSPPQNKSSLYLNPQQRAAFILMKPQIVEGGAAAEAKQALTNMGHILKYKIRFFTRSIYSNNKKHMTH